MFTLTALSTFAGVDPVHHFQGALFAVRTGSDTAYMYEEAPAGDGDAWAIVEVDPDRFLQLWRQPSSSHPEVVHQSPATWPQDRKFHWPHQHFAQGRVNPVPLATVSCELQHWPLESVMGCDDTTDRPVLSFTDGVTRTIWLLTHCVKVMPVKCPMPDVARLQALAGVEGGQPVAVGTLFKQQMG